MDKNTTSLAVVGIGVAVLLWYLAYSSVDRTVNPEEEIPGTTFNAALDACTEHEFFRAHQLTENQELGFTPHRYPTVTGGNISTLIHQGLSALRQPAPQDAKWITRPPAEVMW